MAGMRAAGVTLSMIVMRAMDIRVIDELTSQIVCNNSICIAGNAAEQLNARLCQSRLRTGTNAAAEDGIRTVLYKEAHQCTVALTIGGDHLTAQDLTVFCMVDLELCGVAEMLEHLTIFVRNCDFHINTPF